MKNGTLLSRPFRMEGDDMKAIVNVLVLAGLVLLISSAASAGAVYWTPAHEWAPQGHACAVTAGDIDGDGDIDLTFFCGQPMIQCWNVGSPTGPIWEFGSSPYEGVPFCIHQNGGLGDLDADGDLDLAITCWYDDFVRFYWNVGTPQNPVWEADLSVFDGVPISGGHGSPRLADMDGDGDLDAMLGSWSGRIRYARNVGTATSPSYEYVGWVDGIPLASGCNPTMGLGDLDLDGDLDIVQVADGMLPRCFENVGTQQVSEFVENPDMLSGVSIPPTGYGAGIDLMDIDADGDPDMILARGYGENLLFLNGGATPVEPTSWGVIKAMYR